MQQHSSPPFLLRSVEPKDEAALRELNMRSEVRERLGSVGEGGPQDLVKAIDCGGEMAGVVGLVQSGAYQGQDIELICAIRERFERQGLAASASTELLRSFLPAGTQRVLACIARQNIGGKALARRLGFFFTGEHRRLGDDEIWVRRLELLTESDVAKYPP